MTFAIGENFRACRVVEQLGQGGMATIFKATPCPFPPSTRTRPPVCTCSGWVE
jgi:hypothetical protein